MRISRFWFVLVLTLSLFFVFVPSAKAELITSHVVINEFEQNPPGDERVSGGEFVELFNPTSQSVDIGNWIIFTTHGDIESYTIPSGTVLASGGFWQVSFPGQFIDNEEDSLVLLNSLGEKVDETPSLGDTSNNSSSWQRIPDADTNWEFRPATKGYNNAPSGGSTTTTTTQQATTSMTQAVTTTTSTQQQTATTTGAAASATVQNDSVWLSSSGTLWIFGEVKNTGDVWLKYVKVTATLRDASSGIVDVVDGYTDLGYVAPDSTAGFDILEMDTAKSARVASYTLILEYHEATPIANKLIIMSVSDSKNSYGWFEIMGEVQNQGEAASKYTKVCGIFYGDDGKVIYVYHTYTSPDEIPPGMRYPFKLSVMSDERSSKITRYSLIAESEISQYTSVPEWPSPILIAGIVLSLAVVVVRRKR
jgi:hypothetical protein